MKTCWLTFCYTIFHSYRRFHTKSLDSLNKLQSKCHWQSHDKTIFFLFDSGPATRVHDDKWKSIKNQSVSEMKKIFDHQVNFVFCLFSVVQNFFFHCFHFRYFDYRQSYIYFCVLCRWSQVTFLQNSISNYARHFCLSLTLSSAYTQEPAQQQNCCCCSYKLQ